MLVYHKEPMGYTSIGDKRIYGEYFNYGRFGPTDIPRSVFRKNKELLEEAEYNGEILGKMFGAEFPTVKFKLSEFWRVDFEVLIEIAKALGIKYLKNRKALTNIERRALRRGVLSKITK